MYEMQLKSSKEHYLSLREKLRTELRKTERDMQVLRRKLGKSSPRDGAESLGALEFKRTTTTLSLQEEKSLLQKIERIKREQKLEEELNGLREQYKELHAKLAENKKQVDAVLEEEKTFLLAAEISKRKGGVPIDARQLVTQSISIAKDRIGQFLGKQRANLNKFQKTYCVGAEVDNSGEVHLKGLAEDVDAAKQAVEDFNNEVSKQMRVTAEELKMLKRNHAANMRTIETIMQVSITIVPSSFNANKPSPPSSSASSPASSSAKQSPSSASKPKPNPTSDPPRVEVQSALEEIAEEKTAATLVIRGLNHNVVEACRAVRELAACTEKVSFKSGSASVRALLESSAQALKELEEASGVAIEIDRVAHELRVIGSEKQVAQARQSLERFFEAHEQVSADLPFEHDTSEILSCVVGKGGSIVKRLQAETGASITVVRNDKERLQKGQTGGRPFIRISAPKDKLEGAKKAVLELIEQYFKENVSLRFDAVHHSTVAAARGELIKEVEDVNLSIMRPGSSSSSGNVSPASSPSSSEGLSPRQSSFAVYIRGSEAGVQEVLKRLNALIDAQTSKTFRFPAEVTSTIIGSKGATITKIQKESGAAISVSDGAATVRGDEEQVGKAVAELEAIVAKYKDENLKFYIPPSTLGTLIGKAGSTLNKIRQESGATIDVNTGTLRDKEKEKERERPKDRYGVKVKAPLVRIRGEKEKLMKAKELIEELLKENGACTLPDDAADSFREITVPIPSEESTRKLLGHQGSTVKKLETSFQVHINIERKAQKVVLIGTADESILTAAENVRDLLEQGVFCSEDVTLNARLSSLLTEDAVKKLEDESGASMSISHGKAKVSGAAASVRLAKEWMQDLVRGVTRDVLKLMPKQAQELASKRTTLDRLITQSGDIHASIEVDTAKSLARLKGVDKMGTVDKLKAELLQLLTFFFPENFVMEKLPSAGAVPSLIGRKGATIRKIQVDCEVVVSIVRSALVVYLNGEDGEKLKDAQAEVRRILDEWSQGNVELKVIAEAIPSIIGKKGVKIKQLQADSGADAIDVDKVSNIVRIRGTSEATAKAKELVQRCVEQYLKENTVIEIEAQDIPLLIGPRGATINAIQEETRAQIRINKRDNTVAINGEETHIEAAKEKITQMIQQAKDQRQLKRQQEEELRQKAREEQKSKWKETEHSTNNETDRVEEEVHAKVPTDDVNDVPETIVGTAIEMDTSSYVHRQRQPAAPAVEPEAGPAQVNEIVGLLNSATVSPSSARPESNSPPPVVEPQRNHKVDMSSLTPPPGFEGRQQMRNGAPPGFQERQENPVESKSYYEGEGYSLRLD